MRILKPVFLAFLMAMPGFAQIPTPSSQVQVSAATTPAGSFPLENAGTFWLPTDADTTLGYPGFTATGGIQIIPAPTSPVSLTATRKLILPAPRIGFKFWFQNDSPGGQSINLIGPTGTGVLLPNCSASPSNLTLCSALIWSDGTNYLNMGGGAGGGTGTVTHTPGPLTANHVMEGNGAADSKVDSGCVTDGVGNMSCVSQSTIGDGSHPSQVAMVRNGIAPAVVTNAFTLAAPAAVTTGNTVQGFAAPCTGLWTLANSGGVMSSSCTTPSSASAFPALVAQPTPASTTFLQALNNAANQAVNVVVAGDSFTVCEHTNCGAGGGPLVATNRWAEQMRIQMQKIYGSHGTGMVPLVYGAASSPEINALAWSCSGTFDTSTGTLGPSQSSGNALVHLHAGASCTFHDSRNIAWDALNIYCMTNSASGSLTVNVDGGAFTGTACGTTSGSATAHVVTLAATSSTSHSVVFTSSGDSYLYAAEGTAGTIGVSVHLIGIGGATAAMFGATPAAEMAFSDLIPTGTQAFLYEDQTNDAAGGVATGTFSTQVQNIITHEQGLASAPTVMLVIPPVDQVNSSDAMAPYTAIQTGLCTTNTLTCINPQSRFATVGSTFVGWGTATPLSGSPLWDFTGSLWPAGNGGVHPSDAGSLDEFGLIYAALVNPVGGSSGGGGGGCSSSCTFTGALPVTINGTAALSVLTVTSSNTAGSNMNLGTTSVTNEDVWILSSLGSVAAPAAGGKVFAIGDLTTGIYSWASTASSTGAGFNEFPSLNVYCWSSTLSVTNNSCDTGMSRDAAGSIDFGNATQGDKSAHLNAASATLSGTLTAASAALSGTGTNTMNTGSNSTALTLSSSNAAGTILEVLGTATGVDTWGIQSASSSTTSGGQALLIGDFTQGIYTWKSFSTGGLSGAGYNEYPSLTVSCWSSTASVTLQNCDTGLSRDAAGVVDVGSNGTAGDRTGTIVGKSMSFGPGLSNTTSGFTQVDGATGETIFSSGTAVSGTNRSAPPAIWRSSFYSSGAVNDFWTCGPTLSTGASPNSAFDCSHSGSDGSAPFTVQGNVVCTLASGCGTPPGSPYYWNVQPGLFASGTMLGPVFKAVYATTAQTMTVRMVGTISCTAAPVVNLMDLGTTPATAYGSATSAGSLTTGTSDGVYSSSSLGASINSGHYYGIAFSAGTCVTAPTFDVSATW